MSADLAVQPEDAVSGDLLVAFIGPDDDETCEEPDGGCDGAVNGNPYPIDDAPEPGTFACMSHCRHALQLLSDAPDDMPTYTWSASIGFGYDPDLYTTPDTGTQRPAPADEASLGSLASKLKDDGTLDATPDEMAQAVQNGETTLSDISDHADAETVAHVAQAIAALNPDDLENEMSTLDPTEIIPLFIADDNVVALAGAITGDDDMAGYAQGLAAQGFTSSDQAYTLRDALNDSLGGNWQVVYEAGTYYVRNQP